MQPPATFSRHRVYDPVLRLLHWFNAVVIVLLLLSGMIAQWIEPGALSGWLHQQHGWLGAGLVLGLVGRLVWGLVGTNHARLSDLWHPTVWLESWRSRLFFSAPQRPGHHPAASLAYLLLYGLLLVLAISGLMLLAIAQGIGPFAPWLGWHAAYAAILTLPHQVAGYAVLGFVVLHLAALWLHGHFHRIPVAQSMITGVQYLPPQTEPS
jgi:Ni/Fe-hydrogenase 1 B-type cytochrome subunit